jgi:hypothetical protein
LKLFAFTLARTSKRSRTAGLPTRTLRSICVGLSLTAQVILLAHAPMAHAQAATDDDGTTPPGKDFVYLFDRKPKWAEDKVDTLPALPPDDKGLMQFDVSSASPLTYSIDPKSVSIGKDSVVRYTVVIESSQARNVRYEGMRCDTYETRLYAAGDDTGKSWDRTVSDSWDRIKQSSLNGYQNALYDDYFCNNRLPVAARLIVDNLRYKRIASNTDDH